MIPALVELAGAPWKVLPTGVHQATLSHIGDTFATNGRRRKLYKGLVDASKSLAKAHVRYIYLDGSFVTEKDIPGDYDACWDPTDVDHKLLDPVFLDFKNNRANQKTKFEGEFFPFNINAGNGQIFLDFFQTEKIRERRKGFW